MFLVWVGLVSKLVCRDESQMFAVIVPNGTINYLLCVHHSRVFLLSVPTGSRSTCVCVCVCGRLCLLLACSRFQENTLVMVGGGWRHEKGGPGRGDESMISPFSLCGTTTADLKAFLSGSPEFCFIRWTCSEISSDISPDISVRRGVAFLFSQPFVQVSSYSATIFSSTTGESPEICLHSEIRIIYNGRRRSGGFMVRRGRPQDWFSLHQPGILDYREFGFIVIQWGLEPCLRSQREFSTGNGK